MSQCKLLVMPLLAAIQYQNRLPLEQRGNFQAAQIREASAPVALIMEQLQLLRQFDSLNKIMLY